MLGRLVNRNFATWARLGQKHHRGVLPDFREPPCQGLRSDGGQRGKTDDTREIVCIEHSSPAADARLRGHGGGTPAVHPGSACRGASATPRPAWGGGRRRPARLRRQCRWRGSIGWGSRRPRHRGRHRGVHTGGPEADLYRFPLVSGGLRHQHRAGASDTPRVGGDAGRARLCGRDARWPSMVPQDVCRWSVSPPMWTGILRLYRLCCQVIG